MIKRLKAIWNLLWSDDFFLATYYDCYSPECQTSDIIKYNSKNFNQYFCDSVLEYLNAKYNHLPNFSEKIK